MLNGIITAQDFKNHLGQSMLTVDKGKIAVESIETEKLVVGTNVAMGSNATISWGQVSGATNMVTQITNNAISTATINVNQLYGNIANLANSVNVGSPSDYMQDKYINFYNYSSGRAHVGLQAGGVLKLENKGTYNQDIQIENDSNYIYMSKSYPNGIEIGTTNSSGAIKLVSDRLGFYGSYPISQQSAQKLSSTATTAQIISKINGLMSQLENVGLISTYT